MCVRRFAFQNGRVEWTESDALTQVFIHGLLGNDRRSTMFGMHYSCKAGGEFVFCRQSLLIPSVTMYSQTQDPVTLIKGVCLSGAQMLLVLSSASQSVRYESLRRLTSISYWRWSLARTRLHQHVCYLIVPKFRLTFMGKNVSRKGSSKFRAA